MKKKIFMFAAVATFVLAMTACGTTQTSTTPTPAVEPTKGGEATTAATLKPVTEPAVEPTAMLEPTAMPELTATPVPTSTPTPEPTEAPVAETRDWKTVLRELHSLETYEEREAYVVKLDKSRYEVGSVRNFDLINNANTEKTEIYSRTDTMGKYGNTVHAGYTVYDDNKREVVAEYTLDTPIKDIMKIYGPDKYILEGYSPDTYEYGIMAEYTYDELPEDFWDNYNGYSYKEYMLYLSYETSQCKIMFKYATPVTVYATLNNFISFDWENYPNPYLLTLKDIFTGETDVYGIKFNGQGIVPGSTIEEWVKKYNNAYNPKAVDTHYLDMYMDENGYAPTLIKTWDTLKYYEDLVDLN